jgi:uncharacterized protein (DUF2236 family)
VDVSGVRQGIAGAIRSRVSGPGGTDEVRELFFAPGPRWFAPDRPIYAVHRDVAMFVGGLRALLLQSLHPLAMAGVLAHSDFRDDPWGRLQRTASFLARTTFGPASEASRACAVVRAVHEHVVGVAPDGRPYAANDPHLLLWVHLAEVDSFLAAHQRYGSPRLSRRECDGYVEDMARVARELGVVSPPTSVRGLRAALAEFRPELRATAGAREAARFLLAPPMPLVARGGYAVLSAAAVSLLPFWAQVELRLPVLPVAERVVVRPAGRVLMDVVRWALDPTAPLPDDLTAPS